MRSFSAVMVAPGCDSSPGVVSGGRRVQGPGMFSWFEGGQGRPGSAGGGQRPEGGDRVVGEGGPGLFLIQGQHRLSAVPGQGGGDGEQPQA